MKVIRNNIIPVKGFKAINLFGVLFVRCDARMTEADYNHEAIHSAQMKELWYVLFYVFYLIEWLSGIMGGKSSNEAYHAVSFEREAYSNEDDPNYLERRARFAQWI